MSVSMKSCNALQDVPPTPLKTQMVARCLWCASRIGTPRFRVNGVWSLTPTVPETDGLCPECMKQQLFLISHEGKQHRD